MAALSWNIYINALDQSIRIEQIRLIYRQGPIMVLGATAIGLVMVAFLWRHVPGTLLLGWLFFILFSAVLRVVVFSFYQMQRVSVSRSSVWGGLFCSGSFLSGCVWGALPLLFYGEIAPEYLLLMSTIMAGMISVTAAAGSIYLPSFYAFAVPLAVPVSVTHLFSGVDYLAVTGVMLMCYLLVNSLLAHRGYRQYVELIKARFEKTELMEQLSAEKNTAEQAVIIKNQFIASASHDLRQPLHALGMFIGSLRKRDTDPQRLDIISDMETSTSALSQLLHGMLDISKLEADTVTVEIHSVVLHQILRALRDEFEPMAAQKQLALEIPATDVVIRTDALLMERVLRNLINNAVRYTHSGKVSVTVQSISDDRCEIQVRDTGCGIPEAESEEVFADYYQLKSPTMSDYAGLGLGLSIVKSFCALMQVPLKMDSEVEVGTVFTLSVPKVTDSVSHPFAPVQEMPLPDDLMVLVIDDEPTVLAAMQGMLEDWGCTVMVARSGKDALYQLAQSEQTVDIVLCDYRLGEGELGVDTIEALREGMKDPMPAVIITGDTSPTILREVAARDLHLLHKPVAESVLRQSLIDWVK